MKPLNGIIFIFLIQKCVFFNIFLNKINFRFLYYMNILKTRAIYQKRSLYYQRIIFHLLSFSIVAMIIAKATKKKKD